MIYEVIIYYYSICEEVLMRKSKLFLWELTSNVISIMNKLLMYIE